MYVKKVWKCELVDSELNFFLLYFDNILRLMLSGLKLVLSSGGEFGLLMMLRVKVNILFIRRYWKESVSL